MFGINLYRLEKHHLKLNKSNVSSLNQLPNSPLNYDIPVNNIYNFYSLENNYLNQYQIYKYLSLLTKNIQ